MRYGYQADIPPIKEFPKGGWSIVWHGRVKRNPNVSSEPTIELFIRSKQGDQLIDKTIEVGTGQLPILKIGTYWVDGRLTTGTPSKIKKFTLPGIHISPETTRTIAAWEKIDDGRYAIKPHSLKIPREAANSKCLAIEYNDDPYGIIIPASEIARLYYCNSTDLSHSAFWGEYSFAVDQIVNPKKCGYDEENDRAIVHLRQKFETKDAWTIGRILFDETAREGVQEIHNSLLRYMDTEESGLFNCGMPFIGNTRWIAKGIQTGTKDHPRYLVLQLQKCSHPFPFSELQANRDNNASQADPEKDIPPGEKKPYQRGKNDKKNGNKGALNSEAETNKNFPITNILNQSSQFDFLEDKEIIKPDSKEYNEYKSVPNQPKTPSPTGFGTGQGDYSQDSTNQQAKIKRKKGVGADLEMLTEAVNLLSEEGMKIGIRTVDHMPLSGPEGKRQWAYLESSSHTKRTVIVIDIERNNKHYCWVDIEQRHKGECAVGLLKHKEPINEETLSLILRNLSRLKGVWVGANGKAVDGTNIALKRVLHTWNSVTKLVNCLESKTLELT
ncbi:hypothetical protein [Thiomicrospira sp. WB1]|uniref:hypothetical protein n=1 Tax=Thiomicrospira sp. WB1 TaxID=1685380 RepID=UPI000AE8AD01|nr:hypothetical protein [Thiomicrospira sp. WB1]